MARSRSASLEHAVWSNGKRGVLALRLVEHHLEQRVELVPLHILARTATARMSAKVLQGVSIFVAQLHNVVHDCLELVYALIIS